MDKEIVMCLHYRVLLSDQKKKKNEVMKFTDKCLELEKKSSQVR